MRISVLGTGLMGAPVAERLARSLRKVHSQVLQTLDVSIDPELMFYGEQRDLMELLGNLMAQVADVQVG